MKHKILASIALLLIVFQACTKEDISENGSNAANIAASKKTLGSSANDLLSDTKYKSMVIELVYVDGFEPTATAINNFVSFLQARTFKPDGITVEKRAIPSLGSTEYTIEEIRDIEDANRTKFNASNQIAVWAFFTDGKSNEDTSEKVVLGTAYRNTSFVIYEQTVRNASNSAFEPNRSVLETTVITHEFGHILGLTNLGTTMQTAHEDAEHPKHCNVESCLMYWESLVASRLTNMGSAPQLDAQCIADLQANGGR